jgi:hypothetical protein
VKSLVLVVLSAVAGASAADVRLGGIAEFEFAVQTTDGAGQKAELNLLPELDWRTPWGFDVTAIARLRADGLDRLQPDRSDQDAATRWNQRTFFAGHAEAELRELYVDAYLGDSYLRLGKQQIVWGEADGLKVLDLVNPQRFREFILDEFEDSRLPLWSAKWEFPLGETWNAQLLFIPDQTYHQLPVNGAFAPTSPELVPRPSPDLPVTVAEPRVPDRTLADADAGAQLSAYLDGWDVTLNYLYHHYDTPVVSLTRLAEETRVETDYRRTHTFGGTLSNAFADFTLRAEAGYSSDRYFIVTDLSESDGLVKAGELSYVLGLDWMGLTDTLISAQVFQSWARVGDHASRDRVETDVTLLAQRTFANDTVELSALAIHDVDRGDGVFTGEIAYAYQANLRVRLEVSLFYGSEAGRFGQFDRRDRVLVGLEYGL